MDLSQVLSPGLSYAPGENVAPEDAKDEILFRRYARDVMNSFSKQTRLLLLQDSLAQWSLVILVEFVSSDLGQRVGYFLVGVLKARFGELK
jgi:hypothetical protein